jgi:hypothetical protein
LAETVYAADRLELERVAQDGLEQVHDLTGRQGETGTEVSAHVQERVKPCVADLSRSA